MMGQQPGGQKHLFYAFNLDDHVPSDHLLRGIDQFLDLSELRQHLYHASQAACSKCLMKSRCCPNTPNRKIARSVHESARNIARDIAKTSGYKQSRKYLAEPEATNTTI